MKTIVDEHDRMKAEGFELRSRLEARDASRYQAVVDAARRLCENSDQAMPELRAALECASYESAPVHETQGTISRWAEETFGPSGSNARAIARANREMAELLEHVTGDDRHPEAAEEIADIVIVLSRVMTRLGADLQGEIDRKMATNRARKWRLDGTGHGYHVEIDDSKEGR